MADSKTRAGGRKKKPVAAPGVVIDVGDRPATEPEPDPDDENQESSSDEDGLDTDLAKASTAIEVVDDEDVLVGDADGDSESRANTPAPARGGSLARRDPLSLYMSETRRYPLLTPEEEHALAVRLVEHGDHSAARIATCSTSCRKATSG